MRWCGVGELVRVTVCAIDGWDAVEFRHVGHCMLFNACRNYLVFLLCFEAVLFKDQSCAVV